MNENIDSVESDSIDERIERVCAILESITKNYPLRFEEVEAIREAAATYMLVLQQQSLKAHYRQLRLALGGHLSEEMQAKLRGVGIDPNALDDIVEDDHLRDD